jgi:hypothetical protein
MNWDAPSHGYAHVLAFERQEAVARRLALRLHRKHKATVYVGRASSRSHAYGRGPWVIWKHISDEGASRLSYDPKLRTMPWLDLREMSHPYEFKAGALSPRTSLGRVRRRRRR